MRRVRFWLAGLTMPLALALAGCGPDMSIYGDDDSSVNDDDAVDDDDAIDDDDLADDDDNGDDDDMPAYGCRWDDGTAQEHPGLSGLRAA
jgi:hypothetical protein